MRTEKSRLRRSLMSLQDLLRRNRHWSVRKQLNTFNAALRAITPTTAWPETFVPCKRSIGRSNATGTKCCAAGAGPGASRGTCSTRSNSGNRSCDQSCTFPIASYKLSQCCEPSSEERSAGNPHATFCGTGSARPPPVTRWCRVMVIPTAILVWIPEIWVSRVGLCLPSFQIGWANIASCIGQGHAWQLLILPGTSRSLLPSKSARMWPNNAMALSRKEWL